MPNFEKNGIFDVFYLQKTSKLTIIAEMKRHLQTKLLRWKNEKQRKPLIINGVRQCGKTYLLLQFGHSEFPRVHYINFEENQAIHKIFDQDLNPQRIIDELSFYLDTPIDIYQDLLIFDEIQACPLAITSLKYFCEKMPELALCSAGSLLGVHLNSTSFPVGKVTILNLYPMSFSEFLLALDDQKSLDFLEQCQIDTQTPTFKMVFYHRWLT